ncbi:hypothetical protein DFP72DRAFT_855348 [Ephemerocybe angulata]|uniref:Uncharacterized protein n=1 Tax=Ephemerocybe angulata TaxID=980116 RepID=A0A8H6LWG4_9AGAR|nr:hypothetical protein DFP72DRAFT_855348 [Tulosesus angulatus]
MGRRAKYLTLEAKKEAHKEQRRAYRKRASTTSSRREENRAQYYKKKPPPIVPADIARHAKLPLSWTQQSSLFSSFSEGQDMLVLDELELDCEDWIALTGPPPYPPHITRVESFDDVWDTVSAALHGYSTRGYAEELNREMPASVRKSDVDLRVQLWAEYKELVKHRQMLLSHLPNGSGSLCYRTPSDTITSRNVIWHSRLIVYCAEDIEALFNSRAEFIRKRTDRLWDLQHQHCIQRVTQPASQSPAKPGERHQPVAPKPTTFDIRTPFDSPSVSIGFGQSTMSLDCEVLLSGCELGSPVESFSLLEDFKQIDVSRKSKSDISGSPSSPLSSLLLSATRSGSADKKTFSLSRVGLILGTSGLDILHLRRCHTTRASDRDPVRAGLVASGGAASKAGVATREGGGVTKDGVEKSVGEESAAARDIALKVDAGEEHATKLGAEDADVLLPDRGMAKIRAPTSLGGGVPSLARSEGNHTLYRESQECTMKSMGKGTNLAKLLEEAGAIDIRRAVGEPVDFNERVHPTVHAQGTDVAPFGRRHPVYEPRHVGNEWRSDGDEVKERAGSAVHTTYLGDEESAAGGGRL